MKHRCLSVSVGAVMALSTIGSAQAVLPVYDMANHVTNTANLAVNGTIALKMHSVMDSLNNMGGNNTNYYNEYKYYNEQNDYYNEQNDYYNKEVYNHNVDVTNHNTKIANYYKENNYYCNIGTGDGDGGGVRVAGGDQNCIGNGDPGEIIIPIPVSYGVGAFGDYDNADAYMADSRQVLDGLVDHDNKRFKAVMDSNAVQAQAVDQQARAFTDDSNRLKALTEASTANMGSRMQAVFSNQIAAAQTAEMMQMRALMLADQNAQVVRAQEVAARSAREAVAERRLRAAPDLSTEAVSRW